MSLGEALIPLVLGLLLALRPQAFLRKGDSTDAHDNKVRTLRWIGYALIAIAALYAAIAFFGS